VLTCACVTMSEFEGRQRGRCANRACRIRAHDRHSSCPCATAQIILEEAAYCDPASRIRSRARLRAVSTPCDCSQGLVSEVVVPLLSMQQSVLLCISTILDSGNHYTKMMELVDDFGKTVFETIKITLVCGTHYIHAILFW